MRLGEVFEKQTQGLIVVHISRNAVSTKNDLRHRLGRLQKNVAVPKKVTQLQDLISSKGGAKHKLLGFSVERKPNCAAL